ncbi:MAG: hypothetical protein A2068_07745 [Ignavibacteria bacterium GWB2_35_6b]|nr:MAG: hypothetical protein A2068_07745 [Ignavibacteria bacterium GWB2_35_6b]
MKTLFKIFAVIILVSLTTNAQGKLSLGFNGGLASPSGDFGDIYKSGFGGNAVLSFTLTDNILLSGSVGYYTMDFDNDKLSEMTEGSGIDVSVDAPISIIPVMVGGKYLLTNGKFKPYVTAELGIHSMSIDEAAVTISGERFVFKESASETKMAWAIGAGAYINLSEKIDLEISAKYNGNGSEASTSSTTTNGGTVTTESSSSTLTFLTLLAGINIAL